MRRCVLTLLFLVLPVPLAAQVGTTTDILTGRVHTTDGEAVAGAQVIATSLETGVRRSGQTDSRGKYTIVFPDGGGRYQVTVSFLGLSDAVFDLQRQADEDVLVADVTMQVRAIGLQGLNVQAQRPPPGRGEAGSQSAMLPAELANRLPLADPDDAAALAALIAGVVAVSGDSADSRGSFSVAGQRSSLNRTTVDGASAGSVLTGGQGGSPLGLPQEGTRATQVITNTYDVSRGQFAGGQIAITTRGGTNRKSGSFTYNLRSPTLQGGRGSPLEPAFAQHRLSGGFGGPLVPNRFFYNASLTLQQRSDELFALRPSDPAALDALGTSEESVSRFLRALRDVYGVEPEGLIGEYERTGTGASGLLRLDWVIDQRHTLMLRGNGSTYTQKNARIGLLELRQNGGEVGSSGGGGMLQLTSRLGGSWINELKLSLNAESREQLPFAEVPEGRVEAASILPDGSQRIASLAFGGDRSMPTTTEERVIEASDELSWLIGTTHRLKLGMVLNLSSFEQVSTTNRFGTYTFRSLDDFEAVRPARFTRSLSDRESAGGGLNAGVYLADSWRPRPELQLSYGLRLEASRFNGAPALNPDLQRLFVRNDRLPGEVHLSPRIGFSYRMNQQGEPLRLLRGGVGEFRGRAPFSLYATALEQTGLPGSETVLDCVGADVPEPDWVLWAAEPGAIPSECAGGRPGRRSERRSTVTLFPDEFAAPRSWRGSLGYQTQLFRGVGISIDGTLSRGVALYGARDANLQPRPVFHLEAEDGRPVFAPLGSIVARTGAVPLAASRLHDEFASVYLMRSDLQSNTAQISAAANGVLPSRVFFRGSYTFMRSRDQSSFTCCAAQQAFASTPTAGDPNQLDWARSDFERRHSFNLMAGMPIGSALEVSLIGQVSSGRPFTPLVGGDVNGDGARNDRAFIFDPSATTDPELASAMRRLLQTGPGRVRECLVEQTGRIADRNSCTGDWTHSLNLRSTWRPELPRVQRRLSVSIDAFNLAAGADKLLHGSDDLRGWGQGGRSFDPTLLYVRGFDRAAGAFEYEVNENFGQPRSRRVSLGSPFQVQLSARFVIGQQSGSMGGMALAGMRGAGGGFGGRPDFGGAPGGGRDGQPGGGFDASAVLDRVLTNPVSVMIGLADTLKLTAEQVVKLQVVSDSLDKHNAELAKQAREVLGADNRGEPGGLMQTLAPLLERGRTNIGSAVREAQAILTQEQWQRVPANLRRVDRARPRN